MPSDKCLGGAQESSPLNSPIPLAYDTPSASNLKALSTPLPFPSRAPPRAKDSPWSPRDPQARPAPTGATGPDMGHAHAACLRTGRAGLPALRWAPAPHHDPRPAGRGAARVASGQTIPPARITRKRLGLESRFSDHQSAELFHGDRRQLSAVRCRVALAAPPPGRRDPH